MVIGGTIGALIPARKNVPIDHITVGSPIEVRRSSDDESVVKGRVMDRQDDGALVIARESAAGAHAAQGPTTVVVLPSDDVYARKVVGTHFSEGFAVGAVLDIVAAAVIGVTVNALSNMHVGLNWTH